MNEEAGAFRKASLIALLVLAIGYLSYMHSRDVGIDARQKEAAHRLEVFSGALFAPMEKYDYLPEITASHALVIDALQQPRTPERLRRLNAYLETLNDKARTEAIYVLDASGLTVASSNWRDPLSFVGQNYFFRPYFQDAIRGVPGRFYGLGTVSRFPGYYLSHSITQDNRIIGVVVVKVDLGDLDANWEEDQDIMVVTDENGIVFLSSRKDWKYRALGTLDAHTIEQLEQTKQYGSPLRAPIEFEEDSSHNRGNRIVSIREPDSFGVIRLKRYVEKSATLQNSRWVIRIFSPLAESDFRARQTAFGAIAAFTFGILVFMYFQQTLKRRRENEEAQNALRQAHQELEAQHGELEALNINLQSQSAQLKLTVSELERAKIEADAANLAKSEFLASMSHEIRTPMSAILGLTHLALKTELTGKQRNYLTNVEGAATALLGVLNDILDFSKIEAGKLPIENIPFSLHDIFRNLSAILALSAEAKGIELVFRVDPSLPASVIGDPLRLGQILLNLANNAIKFTERGEVLVSASSDTPSDGEIVLHFCVRDTGIGISAEQVPMLFQSFSQADQSTTRRYGGTGLGLAICRKLTEAMGGSIGVKSVLGQGSTFSFSVRLECADEPGQLIGDTDPSFSGRHILVIDNNHTVREALRAMLESCGAIVECANSGRTAIDRLQARLDADAQCPDVILIDYRMPWMDGIETARQIRLALPRPPKVILMTPYGNDDSALSGGGSGIDALVSKPIELSALREALTVLFEPPLPLATPAPLVLPPTPSPSISGLRILVAEDNEINQHLVREILESAGAHCNIVGNGRDAVRAALNEDARYDVILMDLEMPQMDGIEAARRIRQEARRDYPIIAFTAYATEQDRQRCIDAGIDYHLTKPVNPERLIQEVWHWAKAPRPVAASGRTAFVAETDPDALRRDLAELDALLASNNMGAEALTDTLRQQLAGQGVDALLERLESAIDRLDYRVARAVLPELSDALRLTSSAPKHGPSP